jgi:hypothetical protein
LAAAGEVTLRRGERSETRSIEELAPEEAAAVLKRYVERERIIRRWFDAKPGAPFEAFVADAPRHPVFRLGRARTLT